MVREGYKKTEVGVIPKEWKVSRLRDLAQIRSGVAKNSNASINNPVLVHYLRVANVQDGFLNLSEMNKIKISRNDLRRYAVLPGDVLMNEGGDLDKLGRGSIWLGQFNPCVHQNHVFVIRCDSQLNPQYLNIWSGTATAQNYFMVAGKQTTNLASINKTALGKLPVVIPPLLEQNAIAQALSDMDGLINGLQKLIAKKQDIKTAAMQQLLTGKTRLHGFGEGMGYQQTELGEIPEDWEVLTYGNVFKFLRTANNSRAELSYDGDFGYVHYGDIHTKWSTRLDLNQYKLPMISSKKLRNLDFVNDGDLIMADASEDYDGIGCSVEVGNIKRRKIISGLHTFLMRDPMKIFVDDYRGYLHLIRPVKQAMIRLATGLKVYGLSKSNLKNIQIPVPPKLEQTAIAQALSDTNEELEAFQLRLNKTKAIKQGMMQELLTGRTRLI